MHPTRRLSALVGAVLLILCVAWAPCGAAPAPAKAADAGYDAVFTKAFEPSGPGAAVVVVKDGQVVYRKAIGMASLELGVALAPDMVFRLGSITKQFTAAAVMLLVEQGKLALNDPIEKYLPGYPTQGHAITIEHLLTHTSGIQSYTDIPGWMTGRIKTDMTVAELVDAFKKEPMQFAPGTAYRYNNSAYVLLGAIVEKASGQTYAAFVSERIFTPLGMSSSYYGSNGPVIAKRVQGYTRGGDAVANAQYLSMTQPYSAGSLVSTVDDLARWDAALYTEKLLKRSSLERMWTSYTLANGKPTGYGYGFSLDTLRGRRAVAHGGGIHGFSTFGLRLPEDRVYVAVLCNTDSPKANPGYLARRLAAVAIGNPFPDPVETTVDPKVLSGHAGVYEIDKDTRRTVTVENGTLYTQRTGGSRLEAKASSDTEFFYENSLTRVAFERDASGRTVAMLLYPDGADQPERAPRVADAASGPVVATVDPAIYDAYVGEYELGPNFVLTVTREGDRLMTQATGQQKIEIFPLSETEFFPKVVDARILFVKGADGKVGQLVLKQGGRDMPARRIR
jgi:CubicO group peptidase (beta-lactamase class C family)